MSRLGGLATIPAPKGDLEHRLSVLETHRQRDHEDMQDLREIATNNTKALVNLRLLVYGLITANVLTLLLALTAVITTITLAVIN